MDSGAEVTIADGSNHDSELAGWGLGVELSNNHAQGTTVEYNGLNTYSTGYYTSVAPTILKVFESTNELGVTIAHDSIAIQHIDTPNVTAYMTNEYIGFEDLSGTPHSAFVEHDVITVQDETNTTQMRSTGISLSAGGSITFGNASVQTIAFLGYASPTFTGTPLSTTASVSTNTTQIATTAFVVGQAGAATPLVDGTAAVGTSLLYARQDHVHPTDTTRAALASPTFTGTPLSTTSSIDTNTTQIATTAFVRDMLSDCTWSVPPITTCTTSTSGTGAAYVNASPDYGYLWGPNVNTAGYCQKNFLMFARSNSTYGFNFTKEMRVACKIATNWNSTFVATSLTLFNRLNTGTVNGTLSQIGFGISINLATKVLSILAHNGTTLTTKTTSWAVPYAGIASVDFMVKSDGTGTVYAYADGVLIDSTTGMSTASTSSSTTIYTAVEINSAGGTSSPAQATAYVSNLRSFIAHG
jgi:hypothetical protein